MDMIDSETPATIAVTTLPGAGSDISCQLVPDGFRNDLFEDNLAYFKANQPSIYKIIEKHRCLEYRLCVNIDGSPNIIHMPSKTLLYYSDGDMIHNDIKHKIENIPYDVEISPAYAMTYKPDWYERNPIATRMYKRLFDIGPFQLLAADESRHQFNQTFKPNFIPFMRIYGIGLGYQITELIRTMDVLSFVIYEPEIDLFYTSLYTTPWRLFFKYLAIDPSRRYSLIVGAKPEEAIEAEKKFLYDNFPFIHAARWQLKIFQTTPIKEFMELEKNVYNILGETLTAGWYEDQKAGLVNFIGNLIRHRKVFVENNVSSFMRVAVVGAGPSLDDSISYLKGHVDDFIIFACGTAITPLLESGIVPDYHIHQERRSDVEAVISWAGPDQYKKITALKLNVLEPGVDELYKDAYIFQKFNDPASALLPDRFPVTKGVNPTVTNSAIAFAAKLGAAEVYLFGVDYGAPIDKDKMHATNYVHAHRPSEQVDKSSKYTLKGNLGKTIISTDKLMLSHSVAEITIKSHPQTNWFNVGEGALIKNAQPISVEKMPKNYEHSIDKIKLYSEISQSFDNDYSAVAAIENLESHHGKMIKEYLSAIQGFLDVWPTSRSAIVNTLSMIYQAVDVGKEIYHFIPYTLFSGGMKRFIDNVYMQNALFNSDAEAVEFFNSAKLVLEDYIGDVQKDMDDLIKDARRQLSESEMQTSA